MGEARGQELQGVAADVQRLQRGTEAKFFRDVLNQIVAGGKMQQALCEPDGRRHKLEAAIAHFERGQPLQLQQLCGEQPQARV